MEVKTSKRRDGVQYIICKLCDDLTTGNHYSKTTIA